MIERGGGLIVDITSLVAWADPPARPARAGGASATRCRRARCTASPASSQRSSATAAICCVNIEPGFIATERIAPTWASSAFEVPARRPT